MALPALNVFPSSCAARRCAQLPGGRSLPIQTPLMTNAVAKVEALHFPHRHLLTVEGLSAQEINFLLDLADRNADANRQAGNKRTCSADGR